MDENLNEPEVSDADQAAMEAAFAEAFGDGADTSQPSERDPESVDTTTAKTQAADAALEPQAAPAAQPAAPAAAVADPYAGLPEPVRQALARIPDLETELRRTSGHVSFLQREHDKAVARAAQAAPVEQAPRSKAREQVEDTLPEVVETINEIFDQRMKQHAPSAPARQADPGDDRSPDEIRLDEGFPEWREIVGSNDFRLWVAAQPDAEQIRTTGDMVFLTKSITRFEKHRTAHTAIAQEAARQQALRTSRIDASLTPTRGGARRPSHSQTEEDAFNAGFAGG